MHDGDDFSDDWVLGIRYPSAKPNNRYHTGSVALEMLDVKFRRLEHVVCDHLALVVLEIAVSLDLLDSDTLVHELSLHTESFSFVLRGRVHVDEIVLACSKLGKDEHSWT